MISVFISHSSLDKPIARQLANELARVGVRVWLDEREIKVGDDIIESIERGIRESDYLALILTPRSVNSQWVKEELNAFRIEEVTGSKRKVLPLLFEDCEVPPLLKAKKWADFRRDFEDGLRELTNALGIEHSDITITTSATDITDWRSNTSIIWDEKGKYRNLSWTQIKDEVQKIRGGIAILVEDLFEMLEYKPAPLREKAWVLRNAFSMMISDATEDDADLLARIIVSAWEDHNNNLDTAWMLTLMDKNIAAAALARTYKRSPFTARWIFGTLYDFVKDFDDGPLIYEADLIKQTGKLPQQLQEITRENRFEKFGMESE